MIIGNIKDFNENDFQSENIKKVMRFIASHDLLGLAIGNGEIDGKDVRYIRSSYTGKKFEDAKLEGHDKFLDLQLVLKGEEGFGYVDKRKQGLKVTVPYEEAKDRTFYEGKLDGIINLSANYFALVYPNDLHKPSIKVDDETIEKIVFKIKID